MTTPALTRWLRHLPFVGHQHRRHQTWLDLVASSDHLKRDLGILDGVNTRHHD